MQLVNEIPVIRNAQEFFCTRYYKKPLSGCCIYKNRIHYYNARTPSRYFIYKINAKEINELQCLFKLAQEARKYLGHAYDESYSCTYTFPIRSWVHRLHGIDYSRGKEPVAIWERYRYVPERRES